MNTPIFAALIAAVLLTTILTAPAVTGAAELAPAPVDRADGAVFPKVRGDNLSGKTFRLPGDLEGELNLLLIAFRRNQQADVNTWMPLGDELEKSYEGFRYYEIPTISSGFTVVRSFIDGGMRGGIPSRAQRDRTITLYIDKAPYRKSLNIRSEGSIYAALVDRTGKVLFMVSGRHTTEKAKLLEAAIAKGRKNPAKDRAPAVTGDIFETALASGRFTTLTRALGAAGLVKALQGEGPLTVFAPTDEAFAKLPKGTVENLLKPENREKLVTILTYHVVPGRVPASQVVKTRSAVTLAKKPVAFAVESGAVRVNRSKVVTADIAATNGIIHVIDEVLLPPTRPAIEKVDARGLIELATRRGVPQFNAGRIDSCVAIYEVAAMSLLSLSPELSETDRARLKTALEKVGAEDDARRNAWTLRYALDSVYRNSGSPGTTR